MVSECQKRRASWKQCGKQCIEVVQVWPHLWDLNTVREIKVIVMVFELKCHSRHKEWGGN